MQQGVSGAGRVRPSGGQQGLGQLPQRALHVRRVHIVRGLPHQQRPGAELLHAEAELVQQRLVLQQHGALLRREPQHRRGQQGLDHGGVALRLHAVEVQPFMGGVLVQEENFLPLLHHDVGVEHLPGHFPGRFFRFRVWFRGGRRRGLKGRFY